MTKRLAVPVGIAAVVIGIAAGTMAPASAVNNIKPFGEQERLNDPHTGAPMIGYTVTDLKPSADAVPHNGKLFEATLKVDSMGEGATPMISMFNARAEHGANYPVIANAGPEAVPPGGNSIGKLYFDVVSDEPNSVVYNNGFEDLLGWVPGPPEAGTRP